MDGKKIYQIQINGIKESIDAVEALNQKLQALDKKISEMSSKTVNVTTRSSGGGGGSSTNASLTEEVALEKELNKLKNEGVTLDAKIAATQEEVYKRVQATKDLYKEAVNDQKALAAQARLTANEYSNTMQGMKEHLADLKMAINTTDLGDTDAIRRMTEDANELTNKLKEMEEAYGQFGRNVGNYKSAFDDFGKVSVKIGDTVREFSSVREASRQLEQGLKSLVINGKEDTKEFKELSDALHKFEMASKRATSAVNDLKASSKGMDDMLDMMESFGAMQQIGRGFSTFFGIDDSAIEQQIAKLVALENAMKGIEKIRQQMNTGEGIGGILKSGSDAVDKFVMKLTGAQKRMGMLVTTTKEGSIAVQRLAAGLKLIGGAAITGGIMLLTTALGKLMEDFKHWKTGGYEAGTATEVLNKQLEVLNKNFETTKKFLNTVFFEGLIDSEKHAILMTNSLVGHVSKLLNELGKLEKRDFSKPTVSILGGINIGYGKTEDEALIKANQRFADLAKRLDKIEAFDKKGSPFLKWIRDLTNIGNAADNYKREFQDLGESLAQNLLYEMREAAQKAVQEIETVGKVSEQTKGKIANLSMSLKYDVNTNSLLANVDKFSGKGQYYVNQINTIKDAFIDLGKQIGYVDLDPDKIVQLQIDAMKDGLAKQKKQIELNRNKELADAGGNEKLIKAIKDKYRREEINAEKAHSREMAGVYADLANLRIQLMREGWAKQKAELLHERDERIRQIVDSEKLVGERSAAVRELYKKKMIEAERDWAYEVLKINQDLFNQIEDIEKQAFSREVSNSDTSIANKQAEAKAELWRSTTLPFDDPNNIERRRKYYEEILKIDLEASKKQEKIRQENLDKQLDYNKKEEEERHNRVADAKTIALVMEEMAKVPDATDKDYAEIEAKLQGQLYKMKGDLVDAYNEGKLDFKKFVEYIEKEQNAHNANMNSLEKEYNVESKANLNQGLEEKKQLYNTYYTEVLATIRTKQDEVARNIQKMPVAENDWDVVQISVTKRNYRKALEEYEKIGKDIKTQQANLKRDLALGNITAEDFFMKNTELDTMQKSIEEATKGVKEKQKMLFADFVQSIQPYIQAVGQAANQILSSLSEITQNQYQAQIDEQQKYIEKYEEMLDEQKEITQKYADDVNNIEDELKTARGDRRQQLIDNLNAEMAAQRASLAQQKKIEREKQKADDKKKTLEKEQAIAKRKMDEYQAYVNMAMAISMAAVNKWPIPAIPMMAMAAAATAAQIAAIKSQPIPSYGSGGLLEGKSHKEGGIKASIGTSPIELEGQEFVIRKKTTTQNLALLDFINRSERKLNIDDFIDFYSSGKVKKNIVSASPKVKYAEGGVIPTLRTDIDINDRLLNAMEDYANRPIYVAVTEIEDAQANVNYVRTLSGLNNE